MNLLKKAGILRRLLHRHPAALRQIMSSVGDYLFEPEEVRGSPFFLEIEPTILCNLKCLFCINPFLPRARTHLTLSRFRQIIDQFPLLAKVSLVGIGESFMNPDLWGMIREAKSRGVQIGTTTNGTILNHSILQEIFDSGLDWLNFSLDGATKETYERLRPGAVFEKVLANVRRVAHASDGRPKPRLAVWFVANRQNIEELPQMVELVKGLGVFRLNTQGLHYWGHPDWHAKAVEASAIEDLESILLKVKQLCQESGVEFGWHNFPEREAPRGCKWPWKGSYITADGYVTPCCENGSDPDRIRFGNIFEQPFEEIWNSEGYRGFRRQMKSSEGRPSVCIDCPSYHKQITLKP